MVTCDSPGLSIRGLVLPQGDPKPWAPWTPLHKFDGVCSPDVRSMVNTTRSSPRKRQTGAPRHTPAALHARTGLDDPAHGNHVPWQHTVTEILLQLHLNGPGYPALGTGGGGGGDAESTWNAGPGTGVPILLPCLKNPHPICLLNFLWKNGNDGVPEGRRGNLGRNEGKQGK